VSDLSVERIWDVWTDIDQWHLWQSDIEYAKLKGAFAAGTTFTLEPKRGPAVEIEIINVEPGRQFTDLTRFPGARMYGSHEFIRQGAELEIRTTMSIEGPLAWVWRKLVAEGIANGMSEQTEALIERAKKA
jgi:hypothetical protein